jgi:hypothetical protein
MKRILTFAALAGVSGILWGTAGAARASVEIETFDSPNLLQTNNGNYQLNRDGGTWLTSNGAVQTFGATNWEIATNPTASTGAYGTGYHNIFTQNKPPPGLTNGVVDISGNNALQVDVTINNGTDAGLFVDLQDGEGDFWQYFYGYGRSGNAANDIAAGLQPGQTITQGALPNEEIMTVPLATPHNMISGATFDFTQLVLYRIENDPGFTGSNPNPSDVSFYDMSAVNVPEPTAIAALALGCVLLGRRRVRAA